MKIQCNSFERLVNKKKKNEKIVFPKIFFTETFLRFVLTRVASYMHRSEVIVNDKRLWHPLSLWNNNTISSRVPPCIVILLDWIGWFITTTLHNNVSWVLSPSLFFDWSLVKVTVHFTLPQANYLLLFLFVLIIISLFHFHPLFGYPGKKNTWIRKDKTRDAQLEKLELWFCSLFGSWLAVKDSNFEPENFVLRFSGWFVFFLTGILKWPRLLVSVCGN